MLAIGARFGCCSYPVASSESMVVLLPEVSECSSSNGGCSGSAKRVGHFRVVLGADSGLFGVVLWQQHGGNLGLIWDWLERWFLGLI